MESEDVSEMLETAEKAALGGGEILKSNFGKVAEVKEKEDESFVTSVDIKSEKKILEILRSRNPDHNFYSEEAGFANNNSKYTWVIDPLDGTHNYIHSIPIFGVSIALKHLKTSVLGVVYLPLSGEMFHARKGKGAFLNGKGMAVSETRDIKDFVIIYGGVYKRNLEYLKGLEDLLKEVRFFRYLGAAAISMCYVACGRVDAAIERNVREYDFAAGQLIVEEAGGKASSISGGPVTPELRQIVASNGKLHGKLTELLEGD